MADTPDRIGPYAVGELVSEGRHAAVYRAAAAGRPVHLVLFKAQELLLDSPDAPDRFTAALAPLKYVSGPNVVAFVDSGVADGHFYAIRDAYDWTSLRDLLARQRRADLDLALAVARGAARGLSQLAAAGADHGDLRPENILVGPGREVRLTGQDVARVVDALARDDRSRMAHAEYLAPEQAEGEPRDLRSDIYALGIVLYEALAGEVPFRGANLFETTRQHLMAPVPPITAHRPQLAANLVQLIERCLAKQPAQRYQTAEELEAALAALGAQAEEVRPRGSETQTISRSDLLRARQEAMASVQSVNPEPPSPPPPAATPAPVPTAPPAAPAPTPVEGRGSRAALVIILAIVAAIILIIVIALLLRAAGAF